MSHVTKMKLRLRDLDALAEAGAECGLELHQQPTYAWWGTFVGDSRAYGDHDPKDFGKCEYALRIKGTHPKMGPGGPWEIGVVKAKDGDGYELLYDAYGGAGQALTNAVGVDARKLRQEYAAAAATKKAKATLARKGFTVTREAVAGRIRLRLRKR